MGCRKQRKAPAAPRKPSGREERGVSAKEPHPGMAGRQARRFGSGLTGLLGSGSRRFGCWLGPCSLPFGERREAS
eukprot:9881122-Heterocapsa_arctica.AAC.1